MKEKIFSANSGYKFVMKISQTPESKIPVCDCFIEDRGEKTKLGFGKVIDVADRFLKVLNLSQEEINNAYADPSKKGNTTLIKIFGSTSLASCEYFGREITIKWEDAHRRVLGQTILTESDKQKWIQGFEELKKFFSNQ